MGPHRLGCGQNPSPQSLSDFSATLLQQSISWNEFMGFFLFRFWLVGSAIAVYLGFMLARFLDVAMEMARYEIVEDDGSYWGEIPALQGSGPSRKR
jgi:hypothetical protein